MTDRFANAYIAVDRTLIVLLPMSYGLRKSRASTVSTLRYRFSKNGIFTGLSIRISYKCLKESLTFHNAGQFCRTFAPFYREFTVWVILPPALFIIGILAVLAASDELKCIYEVFLLIVIVLELPILPMIFCAFILFVKSVLERGSLTTDEDASCVWVG